MKSKQVSSTVRSMLASLGKFMRIGAFFACLFFLPWLGSGCNDYPLGTMVSQSYVEVTDIRSQDAAKKVDILFVIDNSGSMAEEQRKLKDNFEAFITELTKEDLNDYQIGIITTDMREPIFLGKLQGTPRIINGKSMSKRQVIDAFTKNVMVGTTGTSYEKSLDAVKLALSPAMTKEGGYNQGFLRDGAMLAVIFVGDEDDCSHNGEIVEDAYDSDVCRIPSSKPLLDPVTGKPLEDPQGNIITGKMEKLTPVSKYIEFLKSLNRKVLVGGIIGNPHVYKDAKNKKLVDPPEGCKQDVECYVDSAKHSCTHITPTKTQCGGCSSQDTGAAVVAPGFRIYSVIKAFSKPDDENWFPICGDNEGFKQALLKFVDLIHKEVGFIPLRRTPLASENVLVRLVSANGDTRTIAAAPALNQACTSDTQCPNDFSCGPPSDKNCPAPISQCCYGEGWILFPPIPPSNQAGIKLSGEVKKVQPGSKIQVVYAAK